MTAIFYLTLLIVEIVTINSELFTMRQCKKYYCVAYMRFTLLRHPFCEYVGRRFKFNGLTSKFREHLVY